MCKPEDFKDMKMEEPNASYIRLEIPLWHRIYLSPKVKGGEVLDIGAGFGETTRFFQNHGAERVIGIEADPVMIEKFRQNFPDAVFVPRTAKVVLIEAHIDHIKSDCEGGEENLTAETHFIVRIRKPTGTVYRFERETRWPWLLWNKFFGPYNSFHMKRVQLAHRMRPRIERRLVKSPGWVRGLAKRTIRFAEWIFRFPIWIGDEMDRHYYSDPLSAVTGRDPRYEERGYRCLGGSKLSELCPRCGRDLWQRFQGDWKCGNCGFVVVRVPSGDQ